MQRPNADEFAPYYNTYISKVPEGDLIDLLDSVHQQTRAYLDQLSEEKGNYAYAEGKWTVKEVIQHMTDCERIMVYRALAIARGEQGSLPGFDQDEYAAVMNLEKDALSDVIEEFTAVRQASILFFKRLTEEESRRKGLANEVTFTPRGVAAICIGHEIHHMNVLKERYG